MGGIDENVPMESVGGRRVTGGSWPARIFGSFMNLYLEGLPDLPFPDAPRRPGSAKLEIPKGVEIAPPPPSTTAPEGEG